MKFPKSARVRSRGDYLRFFQGSQVSRLGSCTLFRVRGVQEKPRLGITIKAKVNSVYRNKLKRQIRESFRAHQAEVQAWDFNVVVPGSVRVDHLTPRKIRRQLEGAWKNEFRL